MKQGIHPEYNAKCKVTCACGHSFVTGSTAKEIQVEICSACHPFFTGKQKLMDTAGRVDKFRERMEEARKREEESARRAIEQKEAKKKAKEAAVAAQFGETPIKLKDLAKTRDQFTPEEKPSKPAKAKKAVKKASKPATAKSAKTAKKTAKKTAAKTVGKKGGAKK